MGWGRNDVALLSSCTGGDTHPDAVLSMEHDPVLGDTILHRAGYIAREAVEEGIEGKTIL